MVIAYCSREDHLFWDAGGSLANYLQAQSSGLVLQAQLKIGVGAEGRIEVPGH